MIYHVSLVDKSDAFFFVLLCKCILFMKTQIQERLWTGSFVKICLVNFFIFVNFHALLPTFPYFVEYLGGDSVTIGLATALFSIASIISRPFLGWMIDTKGRRTVLVIGLIGLSLVPMGYFFSLGVAFAIILRTIHGAFHAASSNASSTWVTDIIPRSRMGEGLGMYGLSMAISTAVAPALGLMVMNCIGSVPTQFGLRALFSLTGIAGLIALVLGASIKNRNYKLSNVPIKISELFEEKSVPASVTQFFFMITYGVIEVYVAIYATKNGLLSGGVYFVFIAVATVLTRVFLGRVIDRHGEGVLVCTGNIAAFVGVLALVFVKNVPGYLFSALLIGYSFGAIQPSLQTMAMHAVKPERRGAASSTFFIAFDMGIAFGAFLAGVLIKFVGYDCMFIAVGCASLISFAYYFVFGRRHESSLNPSSGSSQLTPPAFDLPLVITISREYGSGGHEIGSLLSERLGVKCYDSNLIKMTASESGLNEEYVSMNEQKLQDNRLLYLYSGIDSMIHCNDPVGLAMFHAQSKIFRDLAGRESCVIIGRSEHCSHFTGKEWGNSKYYDLAINSSLLGVGGTVEVLDEICGLLVGAENETRAHESVGNRV